MSSWNFNKSRSTFFSSFLTVKKKTDPIFFIERGTEKLKEISNNANWWPIFQFSDILVLDGEGNPSDSFIHSFASDKIHANITTIGCCGGRGGRGGGGGCAECNNAQLSLALIGIYGLKPNFKLLAQPKENVAESQLSLFVSDCEFWKWVGLKLTKLKKHTRLFTSEFASPNKHHCYSLTLESI